MGMGMRTGTGMATGMGMGTAPCPAGCNPAENLRGINHPKATSCLAA